MDDKSAKFKFRKVYLEVEFSWFIASSHFKFMSVSLAQQSD